MWVGVWRGVWVGCEMGDVSSIQMYVCVVLDSRRASDVNVDDVPDTVDVHMEIGMISVWHSEYFPVTVRV